MQCLVANAEADLYREGSYLLSPTVMHVVRVLQPIQRAAQNKSDKSSELDKSTVLHKYKTTTPRCGFPRIDPICSIGRFGYLLSIMEQHGYILSFEDDTPAGMKKRSKYVNRADDAESKLLALEKRRNRDKSIENATKVSKTQQNRRRSRVSDAIETLKQVAVSA